MKRWIATILFTTFGRYFNNPHLITRLEDRLANSAPIRIFARTIVDLFQRANWELRQLKSVADKQKELSPGDILKKYKEFEEELARKMRKKM